MVIPPALVKAIMKRLSDSQLAAMRVSRQSAEIFRTFDANSDGAIDVHEFDAGLRSLGAHLGQGEVESLFMGLDSNQNGTIEKDELMRLLEAVKAVSAAQDAAREAEMKRAKREIAVKEQRVETADKASSAAKSQKTAKAKQKDGAPPEQMDAETVLEWSKWIGRTGVTQAVIAALRMPLNEQSAFEYMCQMDKDQIAELLDESNL